MASPITQAMKQIAEEKNIAYESVLETVETALAAAYRKDFGNKNQNIKVDFDPEKYDGMTGGIRVFDVKTVVEDMDVDPETGLPVDENGEVIPSEKQSSESVSGYNPALKQRHDGAEDEFRFNPKTMIML